MNFFCWALVAHALFAVPLYLSPKIRFVGHVASEWIFAPIFIVALLAFYVRPSFLFFSYEMHRTLERRVSERPVLGRAAFFLVKIATWIAVLVGPVSLLVFGQDWPPLGKAYATAFMLGCIGVNFGFLFTGYNRYTYLRSVNRWGILATH